MRSYFVRHTDRLQVRDEDLKDLWENGRITIHYPDEATGLGNEDSRSLDPEAYKGSNKTAISRLVELARDGGYVWAEHLLSEDKSAKRGFVPPGTEIECVEKRWHLRGGDYKGRKNGDAAVLKTIKLTRIKPVARNEYVGLRAGKPRQGTIVRWDVGDRLADLVEGRKPARVWPNLSTAQQEAVCAEYLRESYESRPDLPRLRQLLLPVGRTLQDIDLHGLADDGREIFAQVTYHRRGLAETKKKHAALLPYGEGGAHLIFFCPGTGPQEEEGVRFVSADGEVLQWLNGTDDYGDAVFCV